MIDNRPTSKLLMMGLPESGKSTFVAALWEVVRSNDVPDALKIGTLQGDYSYINKLHKLWSEGQPLSRTKVGKEGIVSIPLKNRSTDSKINSEIEIILPDLSGESFDAQWERREMSKALYGHLLEATGLLVFVHSQKFDPGTLIDSNVAALDDIFKDGDSEEQVKGNSSDEPTITIPEEPQTEGQVEESALPKETPFDPKKVPTQTKVVDLLIQTLKITKHKKIRKIALIISAWDLVQDDFNSPIEWLNNTMPLLAQYIESNSNKFSNRIFGISAQGDKLVSKDEEIRLSQREKELIIQRKMKLLKVKAPSKKIIVTDGRRTHNNITAPIQWLINDHS